MKDLVENYVSRSLLHNHQNNCLRDLLFSNNTTTVLKILKMLLILMVGSEPEISPFDK